MRGRWAVLIALAHATTFAEGTTATTAAPAAAPTAAPAAAPTPMPSPTPSPTPSPVPVILPPTPQPTSAPTTAPTPSPTPDCTRYTITEKMYCNNDAVVKKTLVYSHTENPGLYAHRKVKHCADACIFRNATELKDIGEDYVMYGFSMQVKTDQTDGIDGTCKCLSKKKTDPPTVDKYHLQTICKDEADNWDLYSFKCGIDYLTSKNIYQRLIILVLKGLKVRTVLCLILQ